MNKTLRWILASLGGLIGLPLLATAIGVALAESHVAARTLTLPQTSEAVWQVISDYGQQPQWFSEVTVVDRLPDQNGHAAWRETWGGDMVVTMEITEEKPPQRQIRKIANDDLMFGGPWEYDLKSQGSGCQITVTERGFVRNPFIRFVARFVIGHHATIEKYLRSRAANLGAPANISE